MSESESQEEPRRVALITGGSQGIGAAIARRVAAEGAAVIVASRRREACGVVAELIRSEGGEAWPLALDVTDPDALPDALAVAHEIAAGVGPIAWLVNGAGIAESAPLVHRKGAEELARRHMDVNFHGARRLFEALLPDMQDREYGRVVNVASSAGLRGYAYVSAYCASKFALVGYTLAAADELAGSGVTSNAVAPHYVESPMLDRTVERIVEITGRSAEEARELLRDQNPGGRLVTADEVAEAVVGLLTGDENGAVVELDGTKTPRTLWPNRREPTRNGVTA